MTLSALPLVFGVQGLVRMWRSPSKVRKREAGLWQRRFWAHATREEADYRAHVAYCWGNPMKHGYVARAVDWPHSSIHRDVRLGRVEPEWCGAVLDGRFGERGEQYAHPELVRVMR